MKQIAISVIRTDGGTQPRASINQDVIDAYSEAMTSGSTFPPVDVFYDGTDYWLADGFHRVGAAQKAGVEKLFCEIHQGTRDDAQWFSFGANKTNGLYRSNADKQRAVRAALRHPNGVMKSDSQIGKHVGVDHKTVMSCRNKLMASREIPKIESRTVTRNGGTYQQSTTNIGKSAAGRPKETVKANPALEVERELPTISRPRVWAAQETKHFTKEMLRLIRSYEKSHDPVECLMVLRKDGIPIGIQIMSSEQVTR